GAAVFQKLLSGKDLKHELDLSLLPGGLYLIELSSEGQSASYKVFRD
ncbi:MAG: hypothetical protein HRU12_18920, partial [Phaeodactylibacter sp.]|nr:hypothetical protein [Phaeodactylibacter sp.]